MSSRGIPGDAGGFTSSISDDGRFVAFLSRSTNLVPGDTNGEFDVFVRDREAGRIERVSLSTSGGQGNFSATTVSLSAGGRFVVFGSQASNLVPGDTNGWTDVFVRDRQTGQTERVNLSTGRDQADGNSASGGVSRAAISAGGRFVVFDSVAGNLVPGDTNAQPDVFVRDRQAGRTELASVGLNGRVGTGSSFSSAISANGRFVAFTSGVSNLVPGDTNGSLDVFVRDRQAGRSERVSVGTNGAQGTGPSRGAAISSDGRFVAFRSEARNLVPGNAAGGVFVRDRRAGRTELVSVATDGTQSTGRNPAISPGGRYVAFESDAGNLVPGDTNRTRDIFVRNRQAGVTSRVSVGQGGVQGSSVSTSPSVAADGRFVAFASRSGNLVPGTLGPGVFVRTR